jgi:hypothetical protein
MPSLFCERERKKKKTIWGNFLLIIFLQNTKKSSSAIEIYACMDRRMNECHWVLMRHQSNHGAMVVRAKDSSQHLVNMLNYSISKE